MHSTLTQHMQEKPLVGIFRTISLWGLGVWIVLTLTLSPALATPKPKKAFRKSSQQKASLSKMSFREDFLLGKDRRFLPYPPLYRKKQWARMSLELSGIFVLSFSGYEAAAALAAVDWDYELTWSDLYLKLIAGKGLRFDDNPLFLNSPGHAIAGAYYYLFARANGLSPIPSFLVTVFSSAVWELFIEYREVFSINDMIVTPFGGMSFGETFYQLGMLFARGQNTWYYRALAFLFNPLTELHALVDKKWPQRATQLNRFGLPDDIWHRFDTFFDGVYIQNNTADKRKGGFGFGLEAEILNITSYKRAGIVSGLLNDAAWTHVKVRTAFGFPEAWEIEFFTKTSFLGYYQQQVVQNEQGDLEGVHFYVGLMTSYEHWEQRSGNIRDLFAAAQLIGPRFDALFMVGPFQIRGTLETSPDFGLVHALALDAYSVNRTQSGFKSILRAQQYYYAFGWSLRASIEASLYRLSWGLRGHYSVLDSIEGWDRFQEEVTDDFSLIDDRFLLWFWVGFRLPGDALYLQLASRYRFRRGRIHTTTVLREDLWIFARLLFRI